MPPSTRPPVTSEDQVTERLLRLESHSVQDSCGRGDGHHGGADRGQRPPPRARADGRFVTELPDALSQSPHPRHSEGQEGIQLVPDHRPEAPLCLGFDDFESGRLAELAKPVRAEAEKVSEVVREVETEMAP